MILESSATFESGPGWKLIEGDCLDPETGLASLEAESVGLLLTDPPYAITNVGMWHKGRPGEGKRRFDFFEGDEDWPEMIRTVMQAAEASWPALRKPASAYWWCGHREFGPLVAHYEQLGCTTRFLVWAKKNPSPPPPGSGWPSGAELCVYAFQPGREWNHGGRNPPPNSVTTLDSFRHGQPGKANHPTQKPVRLIEPLILASSRPGDIICDPFAGSGTTGVAALKHGRQFIGWEKDPEFFDVAVRRPSGTRPAKAEGQEELFS